MSKDFSHVDEKGQVSMVDVGHKEPTLRIATADGIVEANPETIKKIKQNDFKKGDVITTAHIAGIQAAKKTSELIPLCHNIELSSVNLEFDIQEQQIKISATARTTAQTGVEMEALTAVSVACLTIYDMCKSVDKGMIIRDIRLLEKQGGKSGHFVADLTNAIC
jgi:cyclic pyranopterin phosphate synthase